MTAAELVKCDFYWRGRRVKMIFRVSRRAAERQQDHHHGVVTNSTGVARGHLSFALAPPIRLPPVIPMCSLLPLCIFTIKSIRGNDSKPRPGGAPFPRCLTCCGKLITPSYGSRPMINHPLSRCQQLLHADTSATCARERCSVNAE